MGARGHHKKQGIQGLPPPSFRPDGAVRSAIAPLRSAFARFLLPLRLRARGCPAAQAAARFQVGRRRCAVRPMALSSAWLPALLVVLWAWVLRRRPHTAHSTRVRRSAIVLVVLLSGRYLLWRATSTLNLVSAEATALSLLLLAAEVILVGHGVLRWGWPGSGSRRSPRRCTRPPSGWNTRSAASRGGLPGSMWLCLAAVNRWRCWSAP